MKRTRILTGLWAFSTRLSRRKHGICYHQIRNMVETHSTTSRFDHREQVSCSRLDNFYTGLRAQYPKRYSNCISTLTSRFVRVPTLKSYSPRSCERARNPGKDQDAQQVGLVPSSSKNMEEFGTVGCQSNVDSLFFPGGVTRGMRCRAHVRTFLERHAKNQPTPRVPPIAMPRARARTRRPAVPGSPCEAR